MTVCESVPTGQQRAFSRRWCPSKPVGVALQANLTPDKQIVLCTQTQTDLKTFLVLV
ncbi:MAG: hypothetical protein KME26_12990 [Oscillatoria princeps RMCB-10]|nr:hypothetical protein [Oscillatoria princeps RMCB-10]